MPVARSNVPCRGCTACCKRGSVVLHPALGDDPRKYEHVEATPIAWVLKRKPDGSCIYLRESGCSIWENAPGICKVFDCREYVRLGFEEVAGCSDPEVVAAGKARLNE